MLIDPVVGLGTDEGDRSLPVHPDGDFDDRAVLFKDMAQPLRDVASTEVALSQDIDDPESRDALGPKDPPRLGFEGALPDRGGHGSPHQVQFRECLDALEAFPIVLVRENELESVACVHEPDQDRIPGVRYDVVQNRIQDSCLGYQATRALGGGPPPAQRLHSALHAPLSARIDRTQLPPHPVSLASASARLPCARPR